MPLQGISQHAEALLVAHFGQFPSAMTCPICTSKGWSYGARYLGQNDDYSLVLGRQCERCGLLQLINPAIVDRRALRPWEQMNWPWPRPHPEDEAGHR